MRRFSKELRSQKVWRWTPPQWERAAAQAEQEANSQSAVSVGAAMRRYNRALHDGHQRISKLKGREKSAVGATFALIDARNVVRDSGEIDAVARWCRKAGVLHAGELLCA